MIVQGFAVLLSVTVTHSVKDCSGEVEGVMQRGAHGVFLRFDCNRKGCTATILTATVADGAGV